jgi:hypothetical protein
MTLNILGKKIRVLKQKKLAELNGIVGFYDKNNSLIVLDSELVGYEYWSTMMHEVMHGIIDRSGINQVVDPQLEEVLCEIVSMVLVDNFSLKIKK